MTKRFVTRYNDKFGLTSSKKMTRKELYNWELHVKKLKEELDSLFGFDRFGFNK